MFRQNGYDANNPLSSESHERWRNSLTSRSEEVVETSLPAGEAALLVKRKLPGRIAQLIIQAELVVRTRGLASVAQPLRVQGQEQILDYELP